MGPLGWLFLGAALVAGLAATGTLYLSTILRWEEEQTVGLRYYGLSRAERAGFRNRLRKHARRLRPMTWLLAKVSRFDFARVCFRFRGVPGPRGSCSPGSFARGADYQPRAGDVFVVTQMKSGTTWMQHLVYQIALRGHGDLVETGTALYAVSPWLEGRKSVPVADAPLVGDRFRIIKTHFPASLCPWSPEARYVYVVRHPASCFASCVDFVRTNVGSLAPDLESFEQWFRSPEMMWWGTWPDHVRGWWERAAASDRICWVTFEEMKRDLPGVTRRVASWLGVPLTEAEVAAVVAKCGFDYMQANQDCFEMQPPHLMQTDAELFVRGSADRFRDVPADVRDRIVAWVRADLAGASSGAGEAPPVPVGQWYSDLAAEARPE